MTFSVQIEHGSTKKTVEIELPSIEAAKNIASDVITTNQDVIVIEDEASNKKWAFKQDGSLEEYKAAGDTKWDDLTTAPVIGTKTVFDSYRDKEYYYMPSLERYDQFRRQTTAEIKMSRITQKELVGIIEENDRLKSTLNHAIRELYAQSYESMNFNDYMDRFYYIHGIKI
jgi:hypothetical protein